MKRQILVAIAAGTVAIFMTSCVTMQAPQIEPTRTSTFRTLDINTAPVTADLKIDQTKTTGMAKEKVSVALESIKSTAIRDLLEKNSGDILIEPSYVVVNDGAYITVTVSGYIGRYVNLRQTTSGSATIRVVHPGEAKKVETPEATQSKGLLGLGLGGL